jgi:hypothetical protein
MDWYKGVLIYLKPESTINVDTIFPGPSLFATLSAATILAPVEVPAGEECKKGE